MSDDDKIIVDTKEHLVICEKLSGSVLIPLTNCEGCNYHIEIRENFPGKVNRDEAVNVISREVLTVRASEMTLEPVENNLPPSYQLICGLPRKVKVMYMGEIVGG